MTNTDKRRHTSKLFSLCVQSINELAMFVLQILSVFHGLGITLVKGSNFKRSVGNWPRQLWSNKEAIILNKESDQSSFLTVLENSSGEFNFLSAKRIERRPNKLTANSFILSAVLNHESISNRGTFRGLESEHSAKRETGCVWTTPTSRRKPNLLVVIIIFGSVTLE